MPKSRSGGLAPLWAVLGYLWPYKPQMLGAGAALLFTSAATLTLGKGLQHLIDNGFGGGTTADLSQAVLVIVVISAAIAVGTFLRFYLVSWLGEKRFFRTLFTCTRASSKPIVPAKSCRD